MFAFLVFVFILYTTDNYNSIKANLLFFSCRMTLISGIFVYEKELCDVDKRRGIFQALSVGLSREFQPVSQPHD